MKAYYNSDRTKRMFYDKRIQLWTTLKIDTAGNQVGLATYCTERKLAFVYLEKSFKKSFLPY